MANLKDIERRISSVKSTRQITSTMQMIAAAKVAKSASRLEESMPYTSAISNILVSVSKGTSDVSHPLLSEHENKKTTLVIVVVSDKGLAGGFNSNILRETQHILNKNKKEGKDTKVIACGKKAKGYFEFRNIPLQMEFSGSSDNPQFEQAEEIGNYCIDGYTNGEIDEVILVFNKCKNSMEQTVENKKILPCTAQDLVEAAEETAKQEDGEYLKEIVYEPDTQSVLESLIPTYIRNMIFNALLDSAAGEQVARRVAMQAATDNADEMTETLTRLYNSVRQGAITTELNEIVGGAEALAAD